MTKPDKTRYRTREIGSWWRWDPDVWKPITRFAFFFAFVTAASIFPAIQFISGQLLNTYAEYHDAQAFIAGNLAFGAAAAGFFTTLHCRPTGWRTGLMACIASALVVGIVTCTTIATTALIAVLGWTENVNRALPYAVLVSGIPGIPAMLGAITLLGRWPAAPAKPDSAPSPTA